MQHFQNDMFLVFLNECFTLSFYLFYTYFNDLMYVYYTQCIYVFKQFVYVYYKYRHLIQVWVNRPLDFKKSRVKRYSFINWRIIFLPYFHVMILFYGFFRCRVFRNNKFSGHDLIDKKVENGSPYLIMFTILTAK